MRRTDEANSGATALQAGANALVALRDVRVAADVAVLGAHDHVDRVDVARIVELAVRRRVDACEAARLEAVRGAVAEADLERPAQDDVELLLLVVEVETGLGAGRQDDRVDAEVLDAERAADLAEAGAVADPVDAADGVAVASGDACAGHAFRLLRAGEIEPERTGLAEVDVPGLVAVVGVVVHEDADDARHGPGDGDLLRA